MKGLLITIRSTGRMTVPNLSICLNGFRVTRPSFFAVSSPKKFATYPWAASCIEIEINTGIIQVEEI